MNSTKQRCCASTINLTDSEIEQPNQSSTSNSNTLSSENEDIDDCTIVEPNSQNKDEKSASIVIDVDSEKEDCAIIDDEIYQENELRHVNNNKSFQEIYKCGLTRPKPHKSIAQHKSFDQKINNETLKQSRQHHISSVTIGPEKSQESNSNAHSNKQSSDLIDICNEAIVIEEDSEKDDCAIVESNEKVLEKNRASVKVVIYDEICKQNKLLADVIERCLDMENSSGMLRIINRTLIPIYAHTSPDFKKSEIFQKILTKTLIKLDNEPNKKFTHLKQLCELMKENKGRKRIKPVTLERKLNGEHNSMISDTTIPKKKKRKKEKLDVIDLDDDDVTVNNSSTQPNNTNNLVDDTHNQTNYSGVQINDSPIQTNEIQIKIKDVRSEAIEEPSPVQIHINQNNNNIEKNEQEIGHITKDDFKNDHNTKDDDVIFIGDEKGQVPVTAVTNIPEDDIKIKIQRIEQEIKRYSNLIKELDNSEVDWDLDELSPYIKSEGYKSEIVFLYKELCKLTGTESVKRHKVRLKVAEGRHEGPVRCLEEFINSNIDESGNPPFPDMHDVIDCVQKANTMYQLGWSKKDIETEARALFIHYGRTVQKKRKKREWRHLMRHAEGKIEDPAEKDPALHARLQNNAMLALANEKNLLDKYAEMEQSRTMVNAEAGTTMVAAETCYGIPFKPNSENVPNNGSITVPCNEIGSGTVLYNISGSGAVPESVTGSGAVSYIQTSSGIVPFNVTGSGTIPHIVTGSGIVPDSVTGSGAVSYIQTSTGIVPFNVTGSGTIPHIVTGSGTVPDSVTGSSAVSYIQTPSGIVPFNLTGSGTMPHIVTGSGTVPYIVTGSAAVSNNITGSCTVPYIVTGSGTVPYNVTGTGVVPYNTTSSEALPCNNTYNSAAPYKEKGNKTVPHSERGRETLPCKDTATGTVPNSIRLNTKSYKESCNGYITDNIVLFNSNNVSTQDVIVTPVILTYPLNIAMKEKIVTINQINGNTHESGAMLSNQLTNITEPNVSQGSNPNNVILNDKPVAQVTEDNVSDESNTGNFESTSKKENEEKYGREMIEIEIKPNLDTLNLTFNINNEVAEETRACVENNPEIERREAIEVEIDIKPNLEVLDITPKENNEATNKPNSEALNTFTSIDNNGVFTHLGTNGTDGVNMEQNKETTNVNAEVNKELNVQPNKEVSQPTSTKDNKDSTNSGTNANIPIGTNIIRNETEYNEVSSSSEVRNELENVAESSKADGSEVVVKKEPLDIPRMLLELGSNFTVSIIDIEDPFEVIEISDSSDSEDEDL